MARTGERVVRAGGRESEGGREGRRGGQKGQTEGRREGNGDAIKYPGYSCQHTDGSRQWGLRVDNGNRMREGEGEGRQRAGSAHSLDSLSRLLQNGAQGLVARLPRVLAWCIRATETREVR